LLEAKAPKLQTTDIASIITPGIIPQLHGLITANKLPGQCLSMTENKLLMLLPCKTKGKNKFPRQNFAYANGFLMLRKTQQCVTPTSIQHCEQNLDKWTYDDASQQLAWDHQCATVTHISIGSVFRNTNAKFSNCTSKNADQKWTFEHTSPKHLPLPLDAVPAWKDLQNTRNRSRRAPTHPQHWKQNPSLFIHPNFAAPNNSTLPEDFFPGRLPYPRKNHTTHTEISHQAANLSNSDRDILSIENRQFIESQSIKHETKLANEIRQLYCKITAVQRS
jgi:hypothetical protein